MTDTAFDRQAELARLTYITNGHKTQLGDFAHRLIGLAADAHAAVGGVRAQNLEQTALLEAQQKTIDLLRKPQVRLGLAVVDQCGVQLTTHERDLAEVADTFADEADGLRLLLAKVLPAVDGGLFPELYRQILAALAHSETGANQ